MRSSTARLVGASVSIVLVALALPACTYVADPWIAVSRRSDGAVTYRFTPCDGERVESLAVTPEGDDSSAALPGLVVGLAAEPGAKGSYHIELRTGQGVYINSGEIKEVPRKGFLLGDGRVMSSHELVTERDEDCVERMSLRSRLGIAYPFIVFGVLMVGGVAAIALLTSIVTITIAIRRERRRPEPADDPADEGPLVMS